jgi:two-component sensor histidine kinase
MQSAVLPWIMVISIILQFASYGIALGLIFHTKYFKPWIAIAMAVLLMGIRRLISFIPMVANNHFPQVQENPESIALLISFLMCIGLYFISPMLKDIRSQHHLELKLKDLAIRESHHNVKNSLQMIESMLNLQEYALEKESERNLVIDLISRLQSVALLHIQLYQMGTIEVSQYINAIISNIQSLHTSREVTIESDFSYQGPLAKSTTLNLGLVLNEAITNSMKYAFQGIVHPLIKIQLKDEGTHVCLVVEDNGIGIPAEILNQSRSSFGISMIFSIGSNPGWNCSITCDPGTKIQIQVPLGS